MVRATWQQFCEVRWLSAVREYTHLGLYICTYRPLLHSALFVFTAPTAGRVRKFKGCLAQTDRVFSGAVKVVEEEEEEEARDKGAIWPQQQDSQTNINCTRSWGSEYLLGLLLSIARCVYCKDVTHTEQWEHWILGSVEPNERLCRPAPTFVRLCVCMSVVLACVCVCARACFRDGSSRNTFLSQTVVCSSQDIFLPCTIPIICRNEYTHTLNCKLEVSEVCVRCSRLNRRRREGSSGLLKAHFPSRAFPL